MADEDQPTPPHDERKTDPRSADDESRHRRQLLFVGLGVLVLGLLVGGGIALAVSGDNGSDTTTKTATAAGSKSSSTVPATSTTAAHPQPPTSGRGTGVTPPTTVPPATAPPPTTSNTPVITLTSNVTSPVPCSQSTRNFTSQTASIDFTISWSATNAVTTVIAAGGPDAGPYASPTGPSGSQDFSMSCPVENTDASQTYTVTATGPNGKSYKSITVTLHSNA